MFDFLIKLKNEFNLIVSYVTFNLKDKKLFSNKLVEFFNYYNLYS